MSKIRKVRQRAQRKEKRKIHDQLMTQSNEFIGNPMEAGIFYLEDSFENWAIRKTRREIRNPDFERERIPVLEKALELHKKIKKARS